MGDGSLMGWRSSGERPVSVLLAHLVGRLRRAGPGPYSCAVTKKHRALDAHKKEERT